MLEASFFLVSPHAVFEFFHTGGILGSTINFRLNDEASYCTATLHTVMLFNISMLITVAILKSADSCGALFQALLCLSVCICMLNEVKTSTTKQ